MNFITQGTVLCIPEAQLLNVGLWETQSLSDFTAYTYNADGIRTSKTVNGVKHEYILNGSQILAEKWTQNNVEYVLVYIYDETGAPIGLKYRTSNYANGVFDSFFFEKNLQVDVVAIYNSTGEKIGIYAYTAFGEVVTTTVSGNTTLENNIVNKYNPFRYRGYYFDVETGWYYLQSRYYNPVWGRFLNADSCLYSSIFGFNLFAYCNNNPVNYVDPYGESAEAIFWGWVSGGSIAAAAEPTPFGEIIYAAGCAVLGLAVVVEAVIVGDAIEECLQDQVDVIPYIAQEDTPQEDVAEAPQEIDEPKKEGEKTESQPRSLPTTGEPNSDQELYDEDGLKQKRHYGSDGRAEYDIDYRHSNSDGSHTFPHRHNWNWGNSPPRGPAIPLFQTYVP